MVKNILFHANFGDSVKTKKGKEEKNLPDYGLPYQAFTNEIPSGLPPTNTT